jgi:hypothetical protein
MAHGSVGAALRVTRRQRQRQLGTTNNGTSNESKLCSGRRQQRVMRAQIDTGAQIAAAMKAVQQITQHVLGRAGANAICNWLI